MKLDGLEGRVAVVTGGAQGIGERICQSLSSMGCHVACLDLKEASAADVLSIAVDVTNGSEIDHAFRVVEAEFGTAELLVLNAGVFIVEPFEAVTRFSWDKTIAVNLTAPFVCAQRAIGGMKAKRYGRIVAVGSSAGITGGASSCAAYAASKAGVMCLVKSIANEYARSGITANAIAPALIDTAMMAEQPDGVEDRIPVGRLGQPQEVADLVAYLLSSHAGFITGEVVDINGGFLVH